MRRVFIKGLLLTLLLTGWLNAQKLLIPMDLTQTDHLKAYGVAYQALAEGIQVEWLLNYCGGAFMIDDRPELQRLMRVRGVLFRSINTAEAAQIHAVIEQENMDVVLLEKAPKIAVYAPPNKQAWDDAVILALDYAEVPYDVVWDRL